MNWVFSVSELNPPPGSLRIFSPGLSNSFISTYWKTAGSRVSIAILDKEKETQQSYVLYGKRQIYHSIMIYLSVSHTKSK